jgi:hypothetical protein
MNCGKHVADGSESQNDQRKAQARTRDYVEEYPGRHSTTARPGLGDDHLELQAEEQNQGVKKGRIPEQAQSQKLRVNDDQERQEDRDDAK